MKILVAGGTGFIGRYLISQLLVQQQNVTVLSRYTKKVFDQYTTAKIDAIDWNNLDKLDPNQFDVVINLCGHNIGESRWTKVVKQEIKKSRIETTHSLAQWCAKASKSPHLYNASAIGIYGLQTVSEILPERLTEATEIHFNQATDFLSEVGHKWEQALAPALEKNIKVTVMRFAPVLKKNEGVLKKLMPIFNLGLGGPLGSGNQAFSWIYIDDLVKAILFLLNHSEVVGPVNMCAPQCVKQREFARSLGKVMHRPAFLTTPAWILKLFYGQMAEELLLSGQNTYPERLLKLGFSFSYPNLEAALKYDWTK